MDTVFVVEAGVDYEGSSPIRVFADKYDAEQFAAVCREYQSTRPQFPKGANIDDDEVEAWADADKKWEAAHPAGEGGNGADYFSVVEVPFGAPATGQSEGGEHG